MPLSLVAGRRALIAAQDREFAALQATDRMRAVAQREEAEAEALRQQDLRALLVFQDEQLRQLPPEEDGDIRLCFVLPDGVRLERQFTSGADVSSLHRFVLGSRDAPNFFRLLVRHNRQVLPAGGATIGEAVGGVRTIIQVEEREGV